MRIIAGQWRGRRIAAPPGDRVRPTGDRVREAWMSIVQPHLVDARVLDLFAGSGALGLEALSRGAASADFVESSAVSLRAIAANIETLGAGSSAHVHRSDVLQFLEAHAGDTWDVAFADPPYRMGLAAQVAERWRARPFATVLGIEHAREEAMPEGGSTRKYGDTGLTIYRA